MLKKMNERGFTLIEMLIVLLVISILLIITIPNITKNQSTIQSKG
ncbi:prepilin-type N-terminal cleavage/methylation domain-containing protein, partial [Peribacillus sp. NPDC058002]